MTRVAIAATLLFAVATAFAADHHPRASSRPIAPAALRRLVERGRQTHSSALLVWQNGRMVTEEYFGTPPQLEPLMSSTKSVVALAVARLVDDGKLKSFDQPVSDFYPEWRQGRKRAITIRQLMNHTSGMQNVPNTTVEIYPAPDAVKLALAAELSDPPGTRFSYNNKAVNLLAGIVDIASGQPMDRYVEEKILRPLGITDAKWQEHDKAGNPYAMSGLALTGADFIKIGRLVLGNGTFEGKRIVSAKSLGQLLAAGGPLYPGCGLLWWRIARTHTFVVDEAVLAEMKRLGVDPKVVAAMTSLKDRSFKSIAELTAAMRGMFGDGWGEQLQAARQKGAKVVSQHWSSDFVGYNTNGYLGEYLVVLPAANLVAVRLVDSSDHYDEKTDGFEDFIDDVRALVE
jgi:CubicO group peptidase (beta-lactamase class C family)